MRTLRPSVSVRSAFRPSAKSFSGVIEAMRPVAGWKMLFSTVTRWASFSSRTGSSSLGTHHTRPAPPSFSGSSAAGPWRVKRSNATPFARGSVAALERDLADPRGLVVVVADRRTILRD